MGAVTTRADQMVADLKAGGVKNVTTDIRKFRAPGVLVIPVPDYVFASMDGAASVTWSLIAITTGVGDRVAAAVLEDLVFKCTAVLDIEKAVAGSYTLPSASDPLPAYTLTTTDDLLPEE